MKKISQIVLALSCLTSFSAFAADTATAQEKAGAAVEKVKDTTTEAYQDTKKVVKKGYRKTKDKTCEMINGKMDCAVQRAKNSLNNAGDEIKDKANDVKKN